MPVTLSFPEAADLRAIEQEKLPYLLMNDPGFKHFPMEDVPKAHIIWEQKDNYVGLMAARGVNESFSAVQRVGINRFQAEPGRYGSYIDLTEKDFESIRAQGTWGVVMPLDDLVYSAQDQLLNLRLDRQRQVIWTLLSAGIFSVMGPQGQTLHRDQFNFQTATAAVVWSTVATATPLVDFRAIALKGRGKGVNFGANATAYMNRKTNNYLLNNTNASDIFGKRIENGATINSKSDLDQVLLANDLPTVVVYDDGYIDENGTYQPFVPDGKVVIVGTRLNNAQLGIFAQTINANNPDMAPGPYTAVYDSANNQGSGGTARRVRVVDGVNGGPAVWYPGAVVILSC